MIGNSLLNENFALLTLLFKPDKKLLNTDIFSDGSICDIHVQKFSCAL